MSLFSDMSADRRNKAIAVAVFVLVAAGILYYELFAGGTPNPAASAKPTCEQTLFFFRFRSDGWRD